MASTSLARGRPLHDGASETRLRLIRAARSRYVRRVRLRTAFLLTFTFTFVCGQLETSGAAGLTALTRGKALTLNGRRSPEHWRGVLRVRNDPTLERAPSPACPAVSTFELGLFTVATNGIERAPAVTLDCSRWRRSGSGWAYADPARHGGIARIAYGPRGLVVKLAGPAVLPAPGPVGYAQAWLAIGGTRFHVRFHEFRANQADFIASRTPSSVAARGEAGFWAALWGDAADQASEAETLDALEKAARRSDADGRSRFLLGMLHLYRFGRLTRQITDAGPESRAELAAAVAAFDEAEPLLWDRGTRTGDSRIPGFAAAARYALGVVAHDQALLERGRDELAYAIEINSFFNVFDLMTVVQAEPPDSPAFLEAFRAMDAYLSNPQTLACAVTQPEVCGNSGLAPTALQGTFVLFGDFYAKAGDAGSARQWYQFGAPFESDWRFAGMYADRLATVDARVAAYADADPTNDPPIVGSGAEACASCHNRAPSAR